MTAFAKLGVKVLLDALVGDGCHWQIQLARGALQALAVLLREPDENWLVFAGFGRFDVHVSLQTAKPKRKRGEAISLLTMLGGIGEQPKSPNCGVALRLVAKRLA